MKFLRKGLPLGIIVLSLFLATFLLWNRQPSHPSSKTANVVTTLSSGDQIPLNPGSFPSLLDDETTATSSENYTTRLTDSIAKELIAKNPEGPSLIDGKPNINAIQPEHLIDGALAQEIATFDYHELKPAVHPSDLKVVPRDDVAAMTDYFKQLLQITTKNHRHLPVDPKNPSAQDFAAFRVVSSNILDELYRLPVPKNLVGLHAEEISLVAAQNNIFTILANYDKDLLKSFLAIQAFSKINQDFVSLNERFSQIITDRNIKL
jgi:hypothetical protein